MTSFAALSELTRSCFSLWTLLLCLTGIFSAVISVTQRRYRFALLSLLPLMCSYLFWQVLFDLHLSGKTGQAVPLSRELGGLPWIWWVSSLLLFTIAALGILICVIRFGRRSVTPTAVKHCLDQMPCGVCCWLDNGRVLFANLCMNRLCLALTGGPLLNGKQFYEAAAQGILAVEDRVWRFTSRDILLEGEQLREMIASDITAEYAKTLALEEDKAELSRLNRELADYTFSIDDTVRRGEILQAKGNIHDEMNRLMLSTVAAQSGDGAALDRILSLWEQNALLLCMEAEEAADAKAAARIERLAEALKIRLIWRDSLPALTEKQRSLFFSAAQEAIANAAKHAGAGRLEISFEETDARLICRFTNDGAVPCGEVRFAGGLLNLFHLAEKQGADLSASVGEAFTLSLIFTKNQPDGGCAADRKGV